ncbi:MAG: DNA starvation/stationary phase protection protein [Hyphomicrobium sp.]|nr:DNA starvation/stationary phase protection protein [Hyphomicrobium sp.]
MADDKGSNSKAIIAEKLGTVLGTSYMLQVKTQNFHWNVTGPNFGQLHILFETQYSEIQAAVDEIAERIRALEAVSPGSFADFGKLSEIKDAPSKPPADKVMIKMLADDNAALSKLCTDVGTFADDAGDTATGDLMNGRIAAHDKAAWMLRAHLQ